MKTARGLLIGVGVFALIGIACLVRAADPAPLVPGSATLAPKAVVQPMPPKPEKNGEQVKLGVWIREDGSVDDVEVLSGSKTWREAVVATVKTWKFEPVMWEGKGIPARVEVGFLNTHDGVNANFSPLPNLPNEVHTEDEFGLKKLSLKHEPDMIYPLAARVSRNQKLEAIVKFVVGTDGLPTKLTPEAASSELAWRAAADLVEERHYEPAMIRDVAVEVEQRQGIQYMLTSDPVEALNGATDVVDPAYPYDRLVANESGHAVVRFTLNEKGEVVATELVEASHPDFGGALIAAVESWAFTPVAAARKNVREYRHDFTPDQASYGNQRFAEVIRGGGKISASGAGLDARPKMAFAPSLGYPRSMLSQRLEGLVNVEFVIDRAGLAQFPRAMQATTPEFAWAAVTFVNSMRFMPLTRAGKPVELRVVFPIKFAPPKTEAAPAPAN